MAFRKGDSVKQVVQPISGTVVAFNIDQESGEVQYLVEWTDAAGETRQRYFKDGEVEAV